MKKEEIDYLITYFLYLLPLIDKHTLKYPYLNEKEKEAERATVAKLIVEKYGAQVFWNLCPKCEKLARTPKARQCRYCLHDWH